MARRRKMTPERREFINGLLEHYQPTDAQDVQEMLYFIVLYEGSIPTRLPGGFYSILHGRIKSRKTSPFRTFCWSR